VRATTGTGPPAAPVVYRRRVQWGDGDAGHIVYTARFLDFVMEALEEWWRQVLGVDWYQLNLELGMGSPVVHVELDFRAPVIPGDVLAMEVRVVRLGRSSITFDVRARLADEARERFSAHMISSMIDNKRTRAIPVPKDFRARIEHYMRACERPLRQSGEALADPESAPPGSAS
jgi:4-hydroxybenzoyl-CoA thioesterase